MNKVVEVVPFDFKGQEVRTIVKGEEIWFVAKDVAEILGFDHTPTLTRTLDDDEKGVHIIHTLGGEQKMTIINESGLYSAILKSRKPEANQFKRWITHKVLPSIRKTGGYVANDDLFVETYLQHADEQTKLLFKGTLETIRKQNLLIQQKDKQLEEAKPKVEFAEAFQASESDVEVGTLAKTLASAGINIGRNRLFKWLRENGFVTTAWIDNKKYNVPTQKAINMGLLKLSQNVFDIGYSSRVISAKTLVTPKGQMYFYKKLKEEE
ncbi:phage antirepressor [Bacillus smithii]|uniref:phage antirepressor n=1 Tax=Bacillus smithii TaxID=1479 RepID=UPI003D1A3142